ncbi:MAG: T9SS type A sorting domain-containing protein, partial [Candidatus Cloacimonetes bacterium]|nr:T9SS type A sorting domain-containing protein [Candidatus Cloacimonadota bacterium]
YDEENHYFVIEWSEFSNVYNPDLKETFEVILYDPEYYPTTTGDGEILFQYKEIYNVDQDENYATVGIENESQTEGLLLSYSNIYTPTSQPLENETAILFTIKEGPIIPYLSVEPTYITVSIPSDTIITESITLINNGETSSIVDYTITLSHFLKNAGILGGKGGKSIENDFIISVTNEYIPIMPMDILFYLYHNSPDNEPVYGAKIDFPPGFFVNNATDIGSLCYNNETGDGIEVSWGFGNGEVLYETGTQAFIVNVTIDENQSAPVELEWYIEGDSTGSEPHTKSGIITIQPSTNSYLWLTYPNGGEKMVYGLLDSVTWLHYGDIEEVNIKLSKDDGSTWEMLAGGVDNTGYYEFTVPGPLSDYCRIKISNLSGNVYDISNFVFQITALNITYPDGGAIMVYDTQDSVKWVDCGGIEKVNIELSRDNGSTWEMLANEVDNTGYYEFTVPGPPSDNCKIKITSLDGLIFNMSSGLFSIVDSPINWIIPSSTSGSIAGGQSEEITLTISSEGLYIGTYDAFLKITTNLGQIVNIPVHLEVTQGVDPDQQLNICQLFQNCPNPFSTSTTISFFNTKNTKNTKNIEIKIYNVKGQLVKQLSIDNSQLSPIQSGREQSSIIWDGKDENDNSVSSGLYFYQLKIGNKIIDTKKCVMLR